MSAIIHPHIASTSMESAMCNVECGGITIVGPVTVGRHAIQWFGSGLIVCIAFWNARVDASGLPPRQTRIPENPNQDAFTKRWLEFHQGYRIIHTSEGREERIAVIGEPLKDVDPGFLPRTL